MDRLDAMITEALDNQLYSGERFIIWLNDQNI
jgi:hypothetical protein